MCSTNQAHLPYKQGCAVRIKYIFRTSEDVQYESGTSSVQARMCSTNQAHPPYKRGCAVRIRHIFRTSENVLYESGTSSVQARMCSTSQAHDQYFQDMANDERKRGDYLNLAVAVFSLIVYLGNRLVAVLGSGLRAVSYAGFLLKNFRGGRGNRSFFFKQ